MELLYDVNLQTLAEEHLGGYWCVVSRVLSQTDPDALLARATAFDLGTPDRLTIFATAPDGQQPGTWQVLRDTLLNRPYLAFTLAGADPTRALVTRLRRAPDGSKRQLTLYFLSGMEVVVVTTTANPASAKGTAADAGTPAPA